MKKQVTLFFTVCLWCWTASACFSQTDSTVTYLSENFDEVSQQEAAFYRVIRVTDTATGQGYQKDFYISGEKYQEIYYSKVDSVREGVHAVWFRKGNLKSRSAYVADQLQGKAEDWYENGQVRWERNFENGNLNGDFKTYYPNQQVKRHDVYFAGELVRGQCFDEQGVEVPYYAFQIMPQYPGGQSAMFKFLMKKLNGPFARQYEEGGKAIISFVVGPTGEIGDVRIVSTTHAYLGEKGVKAVLAMPRWLPGIQDGQAVSVRYTVPFNIKKNY